MPQKRKASGTKATKSTDNKSKKAKTTTTKTSTSTSSSKKKTSAGDDGYDADEEGDGDFVRLMEYFRQDAEVKQLATLLFTTNPFNEHPPVCLRLHKYLNTLHLPVCMIVVGSCLL